MKIVSADYVKSSPSLAQCPPADKPEFAFIGRSNVGKSSLINMLCNHQNLAKTSATPGKTQLINHFLINGSWYLVDLPGYGFARVSQRARDQWRKMIEDYLRNRKTLLEVLVLIDSRHSPQRIDLEFVDQLGEYGIPFSLVFTKSDKETQRTVQANIRAFMDRMRERWQFLPAQFLTSAVKKTGRDKLLEYLATKLEPA